MRYGSWLMDSHFPYKKNLRLFYYLPNRSHGQVVPINFQYILEHARQSNLFFCIHPYAYFPARVVPLPLKSLFQSSPFDNTRVEQQDYRR
jgi:hypothetical protein